MRKGPLNLNPHPEGKPDMEGLLNCESPGNDYESQCSKLLSERIVEILRVNYTDKHNMQCLFQSILEDDLKKLLQQYLHSQLNIISNALNHEFSIDETVCYNHATHAKLCDHVKAIKDFCIKAGINFVERRREFNATEAATSPSQEDEREAP